MSIFNLFKGSEEKKENKEENIFETLVIEPEESELKAEENMEEISYYDDFGKEQKMKKKTWVEEILNPAIRKNWNNTEGLYPIVLDAFSKNVYEEVREACLRIYSIDKDKKRKVNILGIFYMETESYDQALNLYEKYLSEEEPTESIYINYAKALEKAGQPEEAEKIYLKALNLNANSVTSFRKYFNVVKKRSKKEYLAKLEELASLKGTWRAKMEIAVKFFKKGNSEKGNYFLTTALKESRYNTEVMKLASGLYQLNRLNEEFEKYILPHFNPENYGIDVTVNVMQFYLETKNYEKGIELCKFTSKFAWFENWDQFIEYEEKFHNMRKQAEHLRNGTNDEGLKSSFFSTNLPIWYYEFNYPNWLLNNKPRVTPNLLMLLFTTLGEQSQITEDLAISLPLYLNEILHYKTRLNYQMAVAYSGEKLVLSGRKYSTDYMKMIKKKNPNLNYVLAGNILKVPNSYEKYDVEIYLYDCATETKIRLVNEIYNKDELYKVQTELVNRFNDFFECMDNNFIKYEKDMENLMLYAEKMRFLLMSKKSKEGCSWRYKRLLYNQRNVVLEDKKNDLKKINLITLLYDVKRTNSQLLKAEKPHIYNMIEKNIFDSDTLRLLLPIIYNVYDDENSYTAYMEKLGVKSPLYISWINKFLDYLNE